VKITSPAAFPLPCDVESGDYDCEDAGRAVKCDFDLVSGPLARLQGMNVPRVEGFYAGKHRGTEVWAMLMEHAGEMVKVDRLLYHEK